LLCSRIAVYILPGIEDKCQISVISDAMTSGYCTGITMAKHLIAKQALAVSPMKRIEGLRGGGEVGK
jgi:hypothetical protein